MIASQDDPIELFRDWHKQAGASEINDPDAFCLATSDSSGMPSARMVLLKGIDDEGGFIFYTNLESRKGEELAVNPQAAMCFHWKSLRRQIRLQGPVKPVAEAVADAYFASRDRGSQIGAWASQQSRPLEGRFELEKQVAKFTARFGLGKVPRPPQWSGFRLQPVRIEFWANAAFRLHDRLVYERTDEGWRIHRLYP